MNYNLGRVLPIFKGEYDNDEIYTNLDVVYYNGSSYVAKEETQGNLPTDTEYWQPIAMAGVLDPEQIADIEQQVIDYVQGQGYVIDPNYTHTDNNYTNADKTKLDGIDMSTKQDTLVSGTNIKTINNENILGSGNINIEGVSDYNDLNNKPSINGTTLTGNVNLATPEQLNSKQNTLVSGTNIATINGQSLLNGGDISIPSAAATDYSILTNKPRINNVELSGNRASSALGLQDTLVSGTNIKTINNQSILGSGNIEIQGGGSGTVEEDLAYTDGGPNIIVYSTGALGNSSANNHTNYIYISDYSSIKYTRMSVPSTTSMAGMAFYDENYTYIIGERVILGEADYSYVESEIPVPQTAVYARFSISGRIEGFYVKGIRESSSLSIEHVLKGKKVSIIGDSICCFGTESQTRTQGYNAPYWIVKDIDVGNQIQSYITWLDVYQSVNSTTPTNKTIGGVSLTASMIGTLQTFTPVSEDVGKAIGVPRWAGSYTTKPWWQVLIDKSGAELCSNASWSGSRICEIPIGNSRHDAFVLSEAYSDYTVNRVSNRDDLGNVIEPDVILIYRGTNDFSGIDPEGGTGTPDTEDLTTPNLITWDEANFDTHNFTEAYIHTILTLRRKYKKAYIILCTLNVVKRVNYAKFPANNGTYTLPDYNNKIREIANLMGCGLIEFDKDGITYENCYDEGYITDSATDSTHPNTKGHKVMGEKALKDITYIL